MNSRSFTMQSDIVELKDQLKEVDEIFKAINMVLKKEVRIDMTVIGDEVAEKPKKNAYLRGDCSRRQNLLLLFMLSIITNLFSKYFHYLRLVASSSPLQ